MREALGDQENRWPAFGNAANTDLTSFKLLHPRSLTMAHLLLLVFCPQLIVVRGVLGHRLCDQIVEKLVHSRIF